MSGPRLAIVLLAALGASPLTLATAHAEDGPDIEMNAPEADAADDAPAVVKDPKLAKKLVAAGQQLVQKGDAATRRSKADEAKTSYEGAINAFQKAIEAGDDPNVYFELAMVEEKLGKLDLAAKHLRQLLAAKQGVKPDIAKKAQAKFDDLTMKVGLVTLKIDPEVTTVSVSGTAVGTAPFAEPLIFMPGSYTLTFESDGYQPKDLAITVEAGSEAERKVELEPIKIVVTPPRSDDGASKALPPPGKPSKTPLYVGGGVAAVALGTGVIFGILAAGEHGTFVAADSTARERADAKASGQSDALVSDLMLGTAVVAAGFTAYWYVFKYKRGNDNAAGEETTSRKAPVMSKLDLAPWVQHEAGGLTVMGSF